VEANNPARSGARRIVLPAGRAHSGGAGSDGFEFCSRNRRLCAHLGSLIIPFHLCAEHLLKHAAVGRQVIATHANIPGAVRTRKYLYGGERSSRRCHEPGPHFPLAVQYRRRAVGLSLAVVGLLWPSTSSRQALNRAARSNVRRQTASAAGRARPSPKVDFTMSNSGRLRSALLLIFTPRSCS
jgi:hypothetical protein